MDSLEQAERKIDELASSGKLDPALLLTMAKAYAGAKETDITREEVRPGLVRSACARPLARHGFPALRNRQRLKALGGAANGVLHLCSCLQGKCVREPGT